MSRYLAPHWEAYQEDVIPVDAPEIQITESRRAFYAGAHALLTAMRAAMDPGEELTDNDKQIVREIDEEIEAFVRAVMDGEA